MLRLRSLYLHLLPLVGFYRYIDVPLLYWVIYVAKVGASFLVAVVYALTSFCLAGKCCGRKRALLSVSLCYFPYFELAFVQFLFIYEDPG